MEFSHDPAFFIWKFFRKVNLIFHVLLYLKNKQNVYVALRHEVDEEQNSSSTVGVKNLICISFCLTFALITSYNHGSRLWFIASRLREDRSSISTPRPAIMSPISSDSVTRSIWDVCVKLHFQRHLQCYWTLDRVIPSALCRQNVIMNKSGKHVSAWSRLKLGNSQLKRFRYMGFIYCKVKL